MLKELDKIDFHDIPVESVKINSDFVNNYFKNP